LSTINLISLLETDVWGAHTSLLAEFRKWRHYGLFFRALTTLNVGALYQSRLHGQGHIERTLLLAALLAWRENLSAEDTDSLLLAAAYHDVGRVDDSYDTEHGTRSAERLGDLTGRTGQELLLLQGAVAAHSRPDHLLEETVAGYGYVNFPHAVELAQLLKDADGLDRVRIRDLNPNFLRHESARFFPPFAEYLFDLYCRIGAASAAYWCPTKKRIVSIETGTA